MICCIVIAGIGRHVLDFFLICRPSEDLHFHVQLIKIKECRQTEKIVDFYQRVLVSVVAVAAIVAEWFVRWTLYGDISRLVCTFLSDACWL